MTTPEARQWNIEACLNTIKQYHPVCECPTIEECAVAGDSWMCESCLCDEAKMELQMLLKEI